MSNPTWLEKIPTRLLAARDTRELMDWLALHNYHLSLAELSAERRRRGIYRAKAPNR